MTSLKYFGSRVIHPDLLENNPRKKTSKSGVELLKIHTKKKRLNTLAIVKPKAKEQ